MIDKTQATKNGIKIIDSTKATNALFDMLQTQFPQTIKDGQPDLNAIANLLGLQSSNIQGYELTFTGKGLANALYNTPCEKVLTLKDSFPPTNTPPQTPPARGFDSTKNAIIIGDNLDALKILKSAYTEKIKMIYIDPPYNTANDNFIYPDNFREDYKAILREVGLIEIDENGEETESENLRFFKNIQSSRTHSGWLSFMLPRLKLARDLLKEDGVIFISIDDNEQANLKILCDEIFGEDNFISCFVWEKTQHFGRQKLNYYSNSEYILCYTKNLYDGEKQRRLLIENIQTEFDDAPLYNASNNKHIMTFPKNSCIFKIKDGIYDESEEKDKYELLNAVTIRNGTNENEFQMNFKSRWSNKTLQDELKKGARVLIKSAKFSPRMIYGDNKKFIVSPKSLIFTNDKNPFCAKFNNVKVGTNENGSSEIANLFGKEVFSYPKPTSLLFYLTGISTSKNSNDIVLDFFAGSGTTAQAVMELNAEDNGNRQFILVQLDEKIDSAKSKVAYDFCKNELKSDKPTISDITTERVRRVSTKIATKLAKENVDLGFKLYSLESKSKLISDEKGALELMTSKLNANDKALNLALQSGKTLDKPIEIVIKNKLYKCEDSYFCVECDEVVLEALSQTSDEYIYIDAYSGINLEHFLNLDARFKERLNVVY